jgi:hypothetical protein
MKRLWIAFALALLSALAGLAQGIPGQTTGKAGGAACSIQTPAVTNIGTNNSAGVSTVTLAGVTVPAGSLIIVEVIDASSTIGGSVSDGVNTYTASGGVFLNNVSTNGFMRTWFAPNASLSAGTITYTLQATTAASISAIYSSNIITSSPLDSAVTATAFGSSTTPTVTSGTPASTGELFVAGIGEGGSTFTQDSGHGWTSPPNVDSNNNVAGGKQVNAGTGTKIFAPTLGASTTWAVNVLGFKPTCL